MGMGVPVVSPVDVHFVGQVLMAGGSRFSRLDEELAVGKVAVKCRQPGARMEENQFAGRSGEETRPLIESMIEGLSLANSTENELVSLEDALVDLQVKSVQPPLEDSSLTLGEIALMDALSSRRAISLPSGKSSHRKGLLQSLRALVAFSPPRVRPTGDWQSDGSDSETHGPAAWQLDLKKVLIGAEFARGCSGSLYSGLYEGQKVAVKILRQAATEEERRRLAKQFRQEVAVLSRLQHPNVVQFVGACQKQSFSCVLTEFLSGGSMRQFLNRQEVLLPARRVVEIALDIARGMEYLHSQGVIHRDLKSENLLMNSEGVVKVMDFGVARFATDVSEMTAETGTYRWMAPEVMGGQPYDSRVDVYSFGIVLWELCTLALPFAGMTPLQAAYAVFHKSLRPSIPAGCPQPLSRLMQLCWQTDPKRRPDFATVTRLLNRFQRHSTSDSEQAPPVAECRELPERGRGGFGGSIRCLAVT